MAARLISSLLLAPVATLWVKRQENRICKHGAPLTKQQLKWAKQLRITNVEALRILREPSLSFPSPQWLSRLLDRHGIGPAKAAGMSLRYGIFLSSQYSQDSHLICHELAHSMQYERAGGIYKFLCLYLFECLHHGYDSSALEKEADHLADQCLSHRH